MSEPRWSPEVLVWPWCMDRFTGSKGDKLCVTEALAARRFPIKQLKAKPPDPKVVMAAERILVRLLSMRDEEDVTPWMLVLSNSPKTLQALALLIPVGYSLTTLGSSAVTGTAHLMDLFFSKRPMNAFEPDPDGELLREVQVAGFLSWEGVNGSVSGAAYQYGRFSALMEHRLRHRLLTMFTAPYVFWTGATQKSIGDQIATTVGFSVAAMIGEIPVLNLKVAEVPRKASEMEL